MRTTASFPRESLSKLYLTGLTPVTALQNDQRFSYTMYVPDAQYPSSPDTKKLPLVITMHGTKREFMKARDNLVPLANDISTSCAIMAPLFPAGITGPEDIGSYKEMVTKEKYESGLAALRYDRILLDMVDEVAERYPGIEASNFFLVGYSGGGQFVHRFIYLHPQRVISASVGAPGGITLLDESLLWPKGTGGIEDIFSGISVVTETLLGKKLQIVVGQQDVNTKQFEMAEKVGHGNGDKRTRVEKATDLYRNWSEHGLDVRLDMVPMAGHSSSECFGPVRDFLGSLLLAQRYQSSSVSN